MTQPVCLLLGAGAGMGGNVTKRFARQGYHACLARRIYEAGLDRLVAEIQAPDVAANVVPAVLRMQQGNLSSVEWFRGIGGEEVEDGLKQAQTRGVTPWH